MKTGDLLEVTWGTWVFAIVVNNDRLNERWPGAYPAAKGTLLVMTGKPCQLGAFKRDTMVPVLGPRGAGYVFKEFVKKAPK